MNKLKFYARRSSPWGDAVDLFAFARHDDSVRITAMPVTFFSEDNSKVGTEAQPFMSVDRDSAQRLMDELWNVGLRPSEGSGSAGSLAATERHLADLRAIVQKTMDVKLP